MRTCRHFNFECLESDRVQSTPQRLKPQLHLRLYGTSELVPFHKLRSSSSAALQMRESLPTASLRPHSSPAGFAE